MLDTKMERNFHALVIDDEPKCASVSVVLREEGWIVA
jgi:hypothetical protein